MERKTTKELLESIFFILAGWLGQIIVGVGVGFGLITGEYSKACFIILYGFYFILNGIGYTVDCIKKGKIDPKQL